MKDERINKLLPYINTYFIEVPLWEEGSFEPVLNLTKVYHEKPDFSSINFNDGIVDVDIEIEPKPAEKFEMFDEVLNIPESWHVTFIFMLIDGTELSFTECISLLIDCAVRYMENLKR